jgi:uncharacterized membrane protein
MRKIFPLLVLVAVLFLCGVVFADQPTPFAPLSNVTGNYTIYQGNDWWEITTNMPLTSQDTVYPETLFYIIVLIGVAFLFLAVIFISLNTHVPSIAILMCGFVTFGTELAAAKMAPYVGYSQLFSQVVPTMTNSTVAVNATHTVYLNHVIVYTLSSSFAYACWGLCVAGGVVAIAGGLSFLGWFQRKGVKDAKNGKYLETDIENDEPGKDGGYKNW